MRLRPALFVRSGVPAVLAVLAAAAWLTWAEDPPVVARCLVEAFGGDARSPPFMTADGRIPWREGSPEPIPGERPPEEVVVLRPADDPLWGELRAWEAAHPRVRRRFVTDGAGHDARGTCLRDQDLQGFVGPAPCVDRDEVRVRVQDRSPWERRVTIDVHTLAPDHGWWGFGLVCVARRAGWGWTFAIEDGWDI